MKITIIGAGNMGGALAIGWARAGKHEVTVTARTEQTLSRFAGVDNILTSTDNLNAVSGADVVVLAVKPWLIEDVCRQIAGNLDFSRQISGVQCSQRLESEADKRACDVGAGAFLGDVLKVFITSAVYRRLFHSAGTIDKCYSALLSPGLYSQDEQRL